MQALKTFKCNECGMRKFPPLFTAIYIWCNRKNKTISGNNQGQTIGKVQYVLLLHLLAAPLFMRIISCSFFADCLPSLLILAYKLAQPRQ